MNEILPGFPGILSRIIMNKYNDEYGRDQERKIALKNCI